ncbi:two-component sensor histidine kinase [Kocuria polaris]|nr:two-component sensor histidine kinase [Kocuria polaris]
MVRSPSRPVFVWLRTGLHGVVLGLTILVIARSVLVPGGGAAVVLLSVLFLCVYGAGAAVIATHRSPRTAWSLAWTGVLTCLWALLMSLTPEAAYLVFPLFFLYLHLLGRLWGTTAILASATLTIYVLAAHSGWSVGGVVGPLVGAAVALLIGFGYQALAREAEEREALMRELLETRDQLSAAEREAGMLGERSRLAREIHDTLAQGLSSIQMLLHAAERSDPERAGLDHIRLARETAAANLADARRFIRELSPPELQDQGLGSALRRMAQARWSRPGLEVTVRVSDTLPLPMHLKTALLRIAQGAMANVIQHAEASSATIELVAEDGRLRFSIIDDGTGFVPDRPGARPQGRSDSFGLRATEERVEQLGGTVKIQSSPHGGTTLTVELDTDMDMEEPT